MSEVHNVVCPLCGERVEAELVQSTLTKRIFECPNTDSRGRTHIFRRTKTRVKVAKFAMRTILFLGTGGALLGGGGDIPHWLKHYGS